MRSPIELAQLAAQAKAWRTANPGPVATFTLGDPWPEVGTGTPVRRVVESEMHVMVQPDPLIRAVAYRQQHDPDERSPWVFVGGDDGVWLVYTKRGAPIGNN